MSSRVEKVLVENKRINRGSLIAYYPIGYPSLDESVKAVLAIAKSGADVIELGIPYSDPVMDGLVIQEATQEALNNGFKLSQLFGALKEITSKTSTPILVMSYWNPVLQYGVERFATELKNAGGAGLITPDLIPDEASEWIAVSEKLDLDRVFLATPSSSENRIKSTVNNSRGFVYAVSTMGITGAREEVDALAKRVVAGVRSVDPKTFTAVGIGISTPEQVRDVNSYADGAIVGSAIVKTYKTHGIRGLKKLVKKLAKAVH
jgi:tryptophan synthase alpha chain